MSNSRKLFLAIFFCCATTTQGQEMTSNSTTDGTSRVGWVPPDAGRTTWDILWGCFSIFLVCSWKCTHLNIPSAAESEAGWHKLVGYVPYWPRKPLRRKWRRKLTWMLIIAIAPEIGVMLAVHQYLSARKACKEANGLVQVPGRYSITHAFYADMGGFLLREGEPEKSTPKKEDDTVVLSNAEKGTTGRSTPKQSSVDETPRFLSLQEFGTPIFATCSDSQSWNCHRLLSSFDSCA